MDDPMRWPALAQSAPHANPPVQQPKPQALPRAGPSTILVSPRQKGNPILNGIKATAWEYADIPADYVLGATTCALFLSLKYHRLHPEYIYNRIRDLKGQYDLRIVLTMVDIDNHEDSLRELSKTSLVNNITIILCWSATEAGRYLELYKTFEHAAPTSIMAKQSTSWSEGMVDFITVPRGINKTDAVSLISNFGSVRTAINAQPEEIGLITGFGDKKIQRWCNSVKEPFRAKKAAKRGIAGNTQSVAAASSARQRTEHAIPGAVEMQKSAPVLESGPEADSQPDHRVTENPNAFEDEEEAMRRVETNNTTPRSTKRKPSEDMDEGVMAALSKLRKQ